MSENLAPIGAALAPTKEDKPTASLAEPFTAQRTLPSTAKPESTEGNSAAEHEEHATLEHTSEGAQTVAVSALQTDMGDVLSDEYTYMRPKRGEIRHGRVIAIAEDSVIVDLGLKREGLIPAEDLQRVGSDVVTTLSVGDEIPVYIVKPEDDKGHILVSWHRARQEQDWIDAQRLYETGEIWEGKVKGYNRGGLIVPFGKIRGFVPASHITGISRRMDPANLQERLAKMMGQTIPLKVIEVNRQSRRLIFSERTAQREWRAQQREKLLSELKEGDHVHGVVRNVCDFGVFVDVGGTDGLVHISELSWHRTNHPSELVKVGDEVDAYVLRVDRERKRIGLSLRLMKPDPWESVGEKYKVGQLVTGVITKLTAFGAFAALEDGIEGLIHISELAEVPPKHPSAVVNTGMVLPLHIVKIDEKQRRVGLSLKRVSEEERAEWEEQQKAKAIPLEEAKPSGETEPAVEPTLAEEVQALPLTAEPQSFEPLEEVVTELPVEEEGDNR